jgi:hypothetical protein
VDGTTQAELVELERNHSGAQHGRPWEYDTVFISPCCHAVKFEPVGWKGHMSDNRLPFLDDRAPPCFFSDGKVHSVNL